MERRKETTLEQRKSIKLLLSANISPPEISRILQISKRTVYRWKKKIEETDNLKNLPRSGVPCQITEAEEQEIIETARRSPLVWAVAC